ncbi:MAG: hypothetical protein HC906_06950 [Bacteroidales bacterium]|nr:hypothetical protein [Bacteroidales bacterium]
MVITLIMVTFMLPFIQTDKPDKITFEVEIRESSILDVVVSKQLPDNLLSIETSFFFSFYQAIKKKQYLIRLKKIS